MKMKAYDRILLALYALLGLIGAAVLGFITYYRDTFTLEILGYRVVFNSSIWTAVLLIAIAAVLLIWSVKMFLLAFKREPRLDHTSVSVQNTEDGSVRISVNAMDTLIKQAIGHQEGIIDVKTKIINHEDSISVHIDMSVASDVHIPNVTMLLQRTVKNFIEEFSGIAVREVTVLVSSIVEIVPAPLALEARQVAEEQLSSLRAGAHSEPVAQSQEASLKDDEIPVVEDEDAIVLEAEEPEAQEDMIYDEQETPDDPQADEAAGGEEIVLSDEDPYEAPEDNPEKDIW